MPFKLLANLPEFLLERTRVHSDSEPTDDGQFVLYWVRTAVRTEENPALDVAMMMADELELPLLVYQEISQHYRLRVRSPPHVHAGRSPRCASEFSRTRN